MSTPLKKVVDDQLDASGMASEPLDDDDARYVADRVRNVLSGLKARRVWEKHIGAILTHSQTLEVTGWSKQALSQAVGDRRVLRLTAEDGTAGYWSGGFTETDLGYRPMPGIKNVLAAWAHTDVDQWTIASWMSSTQPELGGRTPRQGLLDGDVAEVEKLARQASERLAS
ncbi:hypothetical protein G6038_30490 [Rhodococcus sp. 14C212]|uniref:hypothetical protein n=1 Tax=Rhodococcus sp. 14C212 TaxID=2711209 RepID=UPI0013ED9689|nr:hypothetical protein [Rhodococcus sp. 14C212]NGP09712.1 hypothetical protein [Rhodococcus sp. 14C212]